MAAEENHYYKIRVPVVDGYNYYTAEFKAYASNKYLALAKALLKIRGADDFGSDITVEEIK